MLSAQLLETDCCCRTFVLKMKRSKAKSRDDIMALMHVVYSGDDALPLQQDTELSVRVLAPTALDLTHVAAVTAQSCLWATG